MLYCSERANTHIEHGAKGAYREIRSYNPIFDSCLVK